VCGGQSEEQGEGHAAAVVHGQEDDLNFCLLVCVCVKDNPKNKGKDMLQQWSMAKKTLEGGLAELAQVIATKKMENKKVHKLKLPTKNTLSATGRDTEGL
jgi:hypothetical protein